MRSKLQSLWSDLKDLAIGQDYEESPPVVRLTNAILMSSIKKKAEHIRLTTSDDACEVWFFIDGHWQREMNPPIKWNAALLDRLREMAGVDFPGDCNGLITIKHGKGELTSFWLKILRTTIGCCAHLRLRPAESTPLSEDENALFGRVGERLDEAVAMDFEDAAEAPLSEALDLLEGSAPNATGLRLVALYGLGQVWSRRGNYERAGELFEEAAQLAPETREPLMGTAIHAVDRAIYCKGLRGDFAAVDSRCAEMIERITEELGELGPELPLFLHLRADALLALGRFADAERLAATGLAQAEQLWGAPEGDGTMFRVRRARALFRLGRMDEAVAELERAGRDAVALDAQGLACPACDDLAGMHFDAGNLKEARRLAEAGGDLLADAPGSVKRWAEPLIQTLHGQLDFEEGKLEEAPAVEPGTALTLADVVIRDTQGQESDGYFGIGLVVDFGATAEVSRALLERNRELGVFASELGTALTLADVIVRDTQVQQSDGAYGRGLHVELGATAEVTRAVFEMNREIGVLALSEGTALTLEDVVVRDTQGRQGDGFLGSGLAVELGATAEVSRGLFEANRDIGVFAYGAGTELTLAGVVVRDTRAQACAETTCPDSPAGHGVVSYSEARLSMTDFVIARSTLCGALLAQRGELDLSDGEVREQPIGLCVQVDGYDTGRLTNRVRFVDNGSNLQATNLPVPEPVMTLPETP